MSLYRDTILPWLMESIVGRPEYREQRRPALQSASGRVLEIGFGFGGSLSEYPGARGAVTELVGLDPNPGMNRRASARLASMPFPVRLLRGRAEALPARSATFDTVVTNWTLCSLPDLEGGLREIRRVLKPSGRFLFLEQSTILVFLPPHESPIALGIDEGVLGRACLLTQPLPVHFFIAAWPST